MGDITARAPARGPAPVPTRGASFAHLGAPRLTPRVRSRRGPQALRPVLDLNQTQPPRLPSWLPRLRVPVWGLLAAAPAPVPPGAQRDLEPDSPADTDARTWRAYCERKAHFPEASGAQRALGGHCQAGGGENPGSAGSGLPCRGRTDPGERQRDVPPGQEWNLTCSCID